MKLLITIYLLAISLLSFGQYNIDLFKKENRPFFEYDQNEDYYLLKPWDYTKNRQRKYPLVIYLHGHNGAKKIDYLNFLGYDDPADGVDSVALNFQKKHPCFTFIPQTHSFWNNNQLIKQVEKLKQIFPIDVNRIYLIGYSMGGSGSWSFANAYNKYNGHLFAAIVRLAGQSQTEVSDDILRKTAIWIHIGLNDLPKRIDVSRKAFGFFKDSYKNAIVNKNAEAIDKYSGKTTSLVVDGDDKAKLTEYVDIGHGVKAFPFKNPYLIEWIFNQKIE